MKIFDLEHLESIPDDLAEEINGGAPPVFQGGSTGVTFVANFNPDGTATQTQNSSFAILSGASPTFDVSSGDTILSASSPTFYASYGSSASTSSEPV